MLTKSNAHGFGKTHSKLSKRKYLGVHTLLSISIVWMLWTKLWTDHWWHLKKSTEALSLKAAGGSKKFHPIFGAQQCQLAFSYYLMLVRAGYCFSPHDQVKCLRSCPAHRWALVIKALHIWRNWITPQGLIIVYWSPSLELTEIIPNLNVNVIMYEWELRLIYKTEKVQ